MWKPSSAVTSELSSIDDRVTHCLQNEPPGGTRRLIIYELRNRATLTCLVCGKSNLVSEIDMGKGDGRGQYFSDGKTFLTGPSQVFLSDPLASLRFAPGIG